MRSFTIPSGKAELTGVEDGKGPALVFLHAGVADKRMWRDQMAAFGERHRVVAYDRRGFGETRYKPETFSHMQDLRAVLEDRKSTRLNSSHGYISYAVFCLKKK